MLSIYFNTFGIDDSILENPNYIDNPRAWFDNQGGRHYITGDFEKQVIKDIDNSVVVSENVLENPIFGGISSQKISGISKTVILVKNQPQYIFNGSHMGDKAAKWLLKIGKMQDVTIRLGYLMKFEEPFEIRIVNSDKIVTNWKDYLFEATKYY